MKRKKPLRVVIVGLGSIGRRHLANLRVLRPDAEIAIWRHSRHTPIGNALSPEIPVFYDLNSVVRFSPQVAIVANPAPQHIPIASALAAHDVHLLIEKPLSHTLDGLDEFIAECARRRLVCMTGYTLRFTRPLQFMRECVLTGKIGRILFIRAEVGSYLPNWRPGFDYRQMVSARSDLGGGAVFELSHELDYVRWICGEVMSVSAHLDRVGDLEIDVEDTAEIILRFQSGAVGSVHLDLLQRPPIRRCRIVGSNGALEWDGIAGSVHLQTESDERPVEILPGSSIERDAMYQAELSHFLECVAENKVPLVSGEDGRRVVEIAEAIKRSSVEKRWVTLTGSE